MAKKCVVGIVGAVLLGVFLFGTRFFGYVGTMVDKGRQAAQESVPFGLKLEEAKKKVASIDKALNSHMKLMAITKADRDSLDKSIAQTESKIQNHLQEMAYLRDVLQDNNGEYVSVKTTKGTEKKSVPEVTNKLRATKSSFDRAQKSLVSDKKSRDEKQNQYIEYEKQFNQMVDMKEKLSQRIKEVETSQAALETRKASEAAQFDDSEIQEAQDLLNELERDQAVQGNLLDIKKNTGSFEIDPNHEEEGDILEEVNKALEGKNVKSSELISIER